MAIELVYRVRCSGPCRRWLSLPDGYEPGDGIPLAALEPQPIAARAELWPDETAARRAAFAAGWSGGTCPDCRAAADEAATVGPRCGNNPHVRLTPGDRQAVEEFRAYLARRAAGSPPEQNPFGDAS